MLSKQEKRCKGNVRGVHVLSDPLKLFIVYEMIHGFTLTPVEMSFISEGKFILVQTL
jgi:hypothetical protein